MTRQAELRPPERHVDVTPIPEATAPRGRARVWEDVLALATGRRQHRDPVLPGTGGPAGNAELTAWLGLVIIGLSAAEVGTLVSVQRLIAWHIVIGALLIVPALAKTATTGWRMVRYYTGNRSYVTAGPPPMPLRVLGPLVVGSTLALLASGVALVVVGEESARQAAVAGLSLSWLALHQVAFAIWASVTGLHVLARALLAVQLTREGVMDHVGTGLRASTIAVVLAASALVALWVLSGAASWT